MSPIEKTPKGVFSCQLFGDKINSIIYMKVNLADPLPDEKFIKYYLNATLENGSVLLTASQDFSAKIVARPFGLLLQPARAAI